MISFCIGLLTKTYDLLIVNLSSLSLSFSWKLARSLIRSLTSPKSNTMEECDENIQELLWHIQAIALFMKKVRSGIWYFYLFSLGSPFSPTSSFVTFPNLLSFLLFPLHPPSSLLSFLLLPYTCVNRRSFLPPVIPTCALPMNLTIDARCLELGL